MIIQRIERLSILIPVSYEVFMLITSKSFCKRLRTQLGFEKEPTSWVTFCPRRKRFTFHTALNESDFLRWSLHVSLAIVSFPKADKRRYPIDISIVERLILIGRLGRLGLSLFSCVCAARGHRSRVYFTEGIRKYQ